jgi:hypothetical protein
MSQIYNVLWLEQSGSQSDLIQYLTDSDLHLTFVCLAAADDFPNNIKTTMPTTSTIHKFYFAVPKRNVIFYLWRRNVLNPHIYDIMHIIQNFQIIHIHLKQLNYQWKSLEPVINQTIIGKKLKQTYFIAYETATTQPRE